MKKHFEKIKSEGTCIHRLDEELIRRRREELRSADLSYFPSYSQVFRYLIGTLSVNHFIFYTPVTSAGYCYFLEKLPWKSVLLCITFLLSPCTFVIFLYRISATKIPGAMLFVYSVAALGNMKDQKFIRGSPWPQDAYNLLRGRTQITTRLSSVQLLSRVWLFATPWIASRQASLSITNSWSSLKLMSIESVMPSSHLILCRPLLLLPPIPPSIRVFSNESTLHMRWPKYWSFSFSIILSNEHPGLISFRMDWLDLLAVQGTLKSLLQHHSSKASILRCSAFFTVQLSHPYMTTGKTIALTRRTFVDKVMSPLFNKISRLVITFLPRSKRLLISWLQSPSAVILKPPKINKVWHCFHCFPIYLLWSDGTRCPDLSFLNVKL